MTTPSAKAEPGDLFIERKPDALCLTYLRGDDEVVETHPTTDRVKTVNVICSVIAHIKPIRVFVIVDGNLHKISSSTARLVGEGKLTAADLVAE